MKAANGRLRGPARERALPWVVAATACALALRVFGLAWGLPEVYEEAAPFGIAWRMWGWGPGQQFDLNPHTFGYPSLAFYLQLAGQGLLLLVLRVAGYARSALDLRVLLESDPTPFYWTGRFLTTVFGVATVPVLFALGRRVSGRAAAVGAAFLLALNPAHIDKSQMIEVDVPFTFFVVLACWFAVRIAEGPKRRDLVLGGIAAGLATSTKYPGVLLLVPLGLALLMGLRPPARARGGAPGGAAARGATTREAAANGTAPGGAAANGTAPGLRRAGAGGLLVLGAFALALAATSPFLLLDRSGFWRDVVTQRQHMLVGHFGVAPGSGLTYYARALFGDLLGPALAAAGVAGLLLFAALRRERWAIVLAGFVVPFLALFGSWSMKADRYLLPLVPLFVLCGAALLAVLARAVLRGKGSDRAHAAVFAAGVALCALPGIARYSEVFARRHPDTRTLAKHWLQQNYPGGHFVVAESYGPPLASPLEVGRMGAEVFRELTRRGWDVAFYPVQALPLFQVAPERSAKFYDFSLYRDLADLVITSGAVRGRYEEDAGRFPAQLAFYDSLESRFVRVRVFSPRRGPGPEIAIYANPRVRLPFWQRAEVPGPDAEVLTRGEVAGEEAFFLFNLGMNYEAFRFHEAALVCYGLGHGFPHARRGLDSDLDLGAARCLVALGRSDQAIALLAEAEARAASGSDSRKLKSFREALAGPSR